MYKVVRSGTTDDESPPLPAPLIKKQICLKEWAKARAAFHHSPEGYYIPELPYLDPVPETGKRKRYCRTCRKTTSGNDHDACRALCRREGQTKAKLRFNICDGCGKDPIHALTSFSPCNHQYCYNCTETLYECSSEEKYKRYKECRICGTKVTSRFCC